MTLSVPIPFPEQWLRKVAGFYDSSLPVAETVWGKHDAFFMGRRSADLIALPDLLQSALTLCEEDQKLYDKFSPVLCNVSWEQAKALKKLAEEKNWDRLSFRLAGGGVWRAALSGRI